MQIPIMRGMGKAFSGAVVLLLFGCEKAGTESRAVASDESSPPRTVEERKSTAVEREALQPLRDAAQEEQALPSGEEQQLLKRVAAVSASTPIGSPQVARQMIEQLLRVDPHQSVMTAEQAGRFNQMFDRLREQGSAAIPAIAEFLSRNEDVRFDAVSGGQQVGFASVRLGLIDTLDKVGGTEAAEVAVGTLTATGEPVEIAWLTRLLERQSPEQYRANELATVSELLEQLNSGQLKSKDVSALFETAQAVGDSSLVPALTQSVPESKYYATLALAGLRDGSGVPALIELARDSGISAMGNGDLALRPLAQLAIQSSAAIGELLEQARQNKIPDSAWPTVVASLAGSYIQYGNQIFNSTAPSVNWTAEEIAQRKKLLNEILSVTANSTGRQAIQEALLTVSRKVPRP